MQYPILDNLKSLTYIIEDNDGNKITGVIKGEEMKKNAMSMRYQTVSNAIGFPITKEIEEFLCSSLKGEIFDMIRAGVEYVWHECRIIGDSPCYFYFNDNKFVFQNRDEAERILELTNLLKQTLQYKTKIKSPPSRGKKADK